MPDDDVISRKNLANNFKRPKDCKSQYEVFVDDKKKIVNVGKDVDKKKVVNEGKHSKQLKQKKIQKTKPVGCVKGVKRSLQKEF